MYYVDRQQIQHRLDFLPGLGKAADRLLGDWDGSSMIHVFALERVVHLALESVTDVGSLLIDGYIMRDASSYEDIVVILQDEGVIEAALGEALAQLVRQRKALLQEYMDPKQEELLEIAAGLSKNLYAFVRSVEEFMAKEPA